jgi:hypothetical protein
MASRDAKLEAVRKRAKVGSGKRFEALTEQLSHKKGIRNPKAVAAAIGRRKYGAKRMASMAAKGRS